jgi:DNA-binding protein YbaB
MQKDKTFPQHSAENVARGGIVRLAKECSKTVERLNISSKLVAVIMHSEYEPRIS